MEKLEAPDPAVGDAAPDNVIDDAVGRTNDTALSYELKPPVGNDPPALVHANAISDADLMNVDASNVADPRSHGCIKGTRLRVESADRSVCAVSNEIPVATISSCVYIRRPKARHVLNSLRNSRYVICSMTSSGLEMPPVQNAFQRAST